MERRHAYIVIVKRYSSLPRNSKFMFYVLAPSSSKHTLLPWRNNTMCEMIVFLPYNNGISISSLLEHKYSPNTTIIIKLNTCTIKKSEDEKTSEPNPNQQMIQWTKNSVIEKSRHFLLFSTIIASKKDLKNAWFS